MQKNDLFFFKKSKKLLRASCLALSLTLLASSAQVLGSGRPPGRDGREDARARLTKKLYAKKLQAIQGISARANEALANFDFPYKELPISILTTLESRVISDDEKSQIQQRFLAAHLNLAEVKTIQENFLTSFDSGLEYIKTTSARLNSEREYFCGRNPDFNIGEVFASDLLKFTSVFRKDFILKVQPFAKVGIAPMEGFRKNFSTENPENLACIIRMYYGLVNLATVNLEGSNNALGLLNFVFLDSLINKKARLLLSSIYDEEILEALETAQKLLPYVQIIEDVLKIPELFQLAGHAEIIHKSIIKRLPNLKQGNVISPEALKQARAKKGTSKNAGRSSKITASKSTLEEAPRIPSSFAIPSPLPAPAPLEIRYPTFVSGEDFSQASSSLEISPSSPNLEGTKPDMPEISSLTHTPISSTDDSPTKVKLDLGGESRDETKILLGGGPFKTFSKLLSKTYKGSIEKAVILFEALGGKVNEGRSGSRVKFELPHFDTQSTVMLDVLSPQAGDEPTSQPAVSPKKKSKSRSKAPRSKPSSNRIDSQRQEMVLHSPHKHGSKKLAPYHVNDIRDMLLRAGFTEERVTRRES